ncbi:UNKNOWN [Stylonychia lemnae]|uniref:Uncharacterized protein n=1 Tax=Stylonychia lemnae TaxID=5949 RepID=A0A077ZVR8_STYLE|nr:UNKNOWN [Stylonychia lemnae]|eukprot:CDW73969.1 UNKNOWN [Stylonychia lemnae]
MQDFEALLFQINESDDQNTLTFHKKPTKGASSGRFIIKSSQVEPNPQNQQQNSSNIKSGGNSIIFTSSNERPLLGSEMQDKHLKTPEIKFSNQFNPFNIQTNHYRGERSNQQGIQTINDQNIKKEQNQNQEYLYQGSPQKKINILRIVMRTNQQIKNRYNNTLKQEEKFLDYNEQYMTKIHQLKDQALDDDDDEGDFDQQTFSNQSIISELEASGNYRIDSIQQYSLKSLKELKDQYLDDIINDKLELVYDSAVDQDQQQKDQFLRNIKESLQPKQDIEQSFNANDQINQCNNILDDSFFENVRDNSNSLKQYRKRASSGSELMRTDSNQQQQLRSHLIGQCLLNKSISDFNSSNVSRVLPLFQRNQSSNKHIRNRKDSIQLLSIFPSPAKLSKRFDSDLQNEINAAASNIKPPAFDHQDDKIVNDKFINVQNFAKGIDDNNEVHERTDEEDLNTIKLSRNQRIDSQETNELSECIKTLNHDNYNHILKLCQEISNKQQQQQLNQSATYNNSRPQLRKTDEIENFKRNTMQIVPPQNSDNASMMMRDEASNDEDEKVSIQGRFQIKYQNSMDQSHNTSIHKSQFHEMSPKQIVADHLKKKISEAKAANQLLQLQEMMRLETITNQDQSEFIGSRESQNTEDDVSISKATSSSQATKQTKRNQNNKQLKFQQSKMKSTNQSQQLLLQQQNAAKKQRNSQCNPIFQTPSDFKAQTQPLNSNITYQNPNPYQQQLYPQQLPPEYIQSNPNQRINENYPMNQTPNNHHNPSSFQMGSLQQNINPSFFPTSAPQHYNQQIPYFAFDQGLSQQYQIMMQQQLEYSSRQFQMMLNNHQVYMKQTFDLLKHNSLQNLQEQQQQKQIDRIEEKIDKIIQEINKFKKTKNKKRL